VPQKNNEEAKSSILKKNGEEKETEEFIFFLSGMDRVMPMPVALGGSNTTQNPLFVMWHGSSHCKTSWCFYSIPQNLQVYGINA